MNASQIDRIETNVERLASALFGAAVGYASYIALRDVVSLPELGVCAVAAAIVGKLVCSRALNAVARGRPQFKVSIFDVREIEIIQDELLLTDADRLESRGELVLTDGARLPPGELVLTAADRIDAATPQDQPLVLDDVLAELGPESRVVRLFDRKAMPTPGQLKSKIDGHLGQGVPSAAQSDASQALSDALAELRRSLR
jgi:hypothetical protein